MIRIPTKLVFASILLSTAAMALPQSDCPPKKITLGYGNFTACFTTDPDTDNEKDGQIHLNHACEHAHVKFWVDMGGDPPVFTQIGDTLHYNSNPAHTNDLTDIEVDPPSATDRITVDRYIEVGTPPNQHYHVIGGTVTYNF